MALTCTVAPPARTAGFSRWWTTSRTCASCAEENPMADDIGARIHAAIVGAIEQHGWMAQASYNEDFQFVYSIGLHPRYGFELVITGLPPEISYPVLKIIARDL